MSDYRASLLAVELVGTGAHPAAWRRQDSRAEELFGGQYWVDAARAAERAGAALLFVPDSFALQAASGAERGRLDAVALAARVAASTTTLGLVPTVTVTHTEPFHVSKAIASLDIATLGRAGWQVDVSRGQDQAALFGRKDAQGSDSLWHEAADTVEVVTRLWDSWEDDAEIRDESTNRFIDRDKLHYIDFDGEFFSVKGPSITPRSPQGHPPIAVYAADAESTVFAVQRADIVRIRAKSLDDAAALTARIRRGVVSAGRDPETVRILLDVDALVAESATAELSQLEQWVQQQYSTDTVSYIGDAAGVTELTEDLDIAVADGVTIRPLTLSTLGALPSAASGAGTLRERLGLTRPTNQYAAN